MLEVENHQPKSSTSMTLSLHPDSRTNNTFNICEHKNNNATYFTGLLVAKVR